MLRAIAQTSRRIGLAAAALAVLPSLCACDRQPERTPIPKAYVETAHMPGFGSIRFWGDVPSPTFDRWLTDKTKAISEAVAKGQLPGSADHARFLALSGGGDKGAFAVGVLTGWSARGDRPEFEAVTGVSTGALAAPFAFLGPSYDLLLQDIYTKAGASAFPRSRGIFGFFGNSLYDAKPLEDLIRRYATDELLDKIGAQYKLGRRILILTTDLDAQRPVIWDLSAVAASDNPMRRELFVKILLASSALPGIFPPVQMPVVADDGKTYEELHADGGVTAELVFVPPDVKLLPIEQKFFKTKRQRSLFVIENDQIAPVYSPVKNKLVPLTGTAVATLVKYQVLSDLRAIRRTANANETSFQFVSIPPDFDVVDSGLFDPVYAQKLFEAGKAAGSSARWASDPAASPKLAAEAGKMGTGMVPMLEKQ